MSDLKLTLSPQALMQYQAVEMSKISDALSNSAILYPTPFESFIEAKEVRFKVSLLITTFGDTQIFNFLLVLGWYERSDGWSNGQRSK